MSVGGPNTGGVCLCPVTGFLDRPQDPWLWLWATRVTGARRLPSRCDHGGGIRVVGPTRGCTRDNVALLSVTCNRVTTLDQSPPASMEEAVAKGKDQKMARCQLAMYTVSWRDVYEVLVWDLSDCLLGAVGSARSSRRGVLRLNC